MPVRSVRGGSLVYAISEMDGRSRPCHRRVFRRERKEKR